MELLRYYELVPGESKAILKTISVTDIESYLTDQNRKSELADFIYQRFFHRYIKPFKYVKPLEINDERYQKIKVEKIDSATNQTTEVLKNEYGLLYKNGFSIMANCCLLIETLESFYQGWENTDGISQKAFESFFARDRNFEQFSSGKCPAEFYKHIRCGILHQGETTNGWSITRDTNVCPLLDRGQRKINASAFLERLERSINDYKEELNEAKWHHLVWVNARKKVKAIIQNSKTN